MSGLPSKKTQSEMEEFMDREFGSGPESDKFPRVVWLFATVPASLVVLGLYLSYAGGTQVAIAFQTSNWPATQGVVTLCEVREFVEGGERMFSDEYTRYAADFLYEYTVNQQVYESGRIAIGEAGVRGRSEATARLAPYAAGAAVTVFYNAENPAEACLTAGAGVSAYTLLGAGLLMVVLTVRLSLSWINELGLLKRLSSSDKRPADESLGA